MNRVIPSIPTNEEKIKNIIGSERSKIYDQIKNCFEKTNVAFREAKTASFEKKNYSSIEKVELFSQSLNDACQKLQHANNDFGKYAQARIPLYTTEQWTPEGYNFKTSLNPQYQSLFDKITSILYEIGRCLNQIDLFLNNENNNDVWLLNDADSYASFFKLFASANGSLVCAKIEFEE